MVDGPVWGPVAVTAAGFVAGDVFLPDWCAPFTGLAAAALYVWAVLAWADRHPTPEPAPEHPPMRVLVRGDDVQDEVVRGESRGVT